MSFSVQSVLDHFGLERRPFALAPDPNFVFWSSNHKRAQSMLNYGIMSSAPITLVTGDIGAGKTTMLRDLLMQADDEVQFGLIANATPADHAEMLRLILIALDQDVPETDSYAKLYAELEMYLVEAYSKGHRVVLIFDEAQNLDRNSLEHLRLITNINYAEHELVQLVLIGQNELLDMVKRPDLKQLAQRISARAHLHPLHADEVGDYVRARLQAAGCDRELFEADTFALLHDYTGGVPRLINQMCDYALLIAFGDGAETISCEHLKEVIEENFLIGIEQETQLRAVP